MWVFTSILQIPYLEWHWNNIFTFNKTQTAKNEALQKINVDELDLTSPLNERQSTHTKTERDSQQN